MNNDRATSDFPGFPLLELFYQLREAGLPLGAEEYQLALRSLQSGFGLSDRAALKRVCRTLWVKSEEQGWIFEGCFDRTLQWELEGLKLRSQPHASSKALRGAIAGASRGDRGRSRRPWVAIVLYAVFVLTVVRGAMEKFYFQAAEAPETEQPSLEAGPEDANAPEGDAPDDTEGAIAPQQTPAPQPIEDFVKKFPWWIPGALLALVAIATLLASYDRLRQLQQEFEYRQNEWVAWEDLLKGLLEVQPAGALPDYWPLGRREIEQSWRRLRSLVREGAAIEIDVPATVREIGRQGFLAAPIFVPRRHNRSQLWLFVDRDGSMVPFHGLGERLVEAASYGCGFVVVRYFHNVPHQYLYRDPYRVEGEAIETLLAKANAQNARVLAFGDGGALRGGYNPDRVRETIAFFDKLRVRRVVWLNPLPRSRWRGTSAGEIARSIPMFPCDLGGFRDAIACLRKG